MFGQGMAALFGAGPKNPKVPDLPRVDQQKVIGDTINANIANLPGAEQLASATNKFNQDEILKMLRAAFPGYDNVTNKASGVIQSQLSGEVPQDVQNFLQGKSAAKAVGGGYGGSGLHGNLGLRDLGLTSLQQTQQGLNSASQWLQTIRATSVAPQFNVASMFETPQNALGREERYLESKWQRDWTQNQIKALGSPFNQALWNALGNFDKTTWSIAQSAGSAYAGGGMGGMGGGGGGQFSAPSSLGQGISGPQFRNMMADYYGTSNTGEKY